MEDTHSGKEVVLTIDAAIEVILIKIFENWPNYTHSRLLEAFNLVKSALLSYIDPDIDIDYVCTRIIGAHSKGLQKVDEELR